MGKDEKERPQFTESDKEMLECIKKGVEDNYEAVKLLLLDSLSNRVGGFDTAAAGSSDALPDFAIFDVDVELMLGRETEEKENDKVITPPKSVDKCKNYIIKGDVYQTNIAVKVVGKKDTVYRLNVRFLGFWNNDVACKKSPDNNVNIKMFKQFESFTKLGCLKNDGFSVIDMENLILDFKGTVYSELQSQRQNSNYRKILLALDVEVMQDGASRVFQYIKPLDGGKLFF